MDRLQDAIFPESRDPTFKWRYLAHQIKKKSAIQLVSREEQGPSSSKSSLSPPNVNSPTFGLASSNTQAEMPQVVLGSTTSQVMNSQGSIEDSVDALHKSDLTLANTALNLTPTLRPPILVHDPPQLGNSSQSLLTGVPTLATTPPPGVKLPDPMYDLAWADITVNDVDDTLVSSNPKSVAQPFPLGEQGSPLPMFFWPICQEEQVSSMSRSTTGSETLVSQTSFGAGPLRPQLVHRASSQRTVRQYLKPTGPAGRERRGSETTFIQDSKVGPTLSRPSSKTRKFMWIHTPFNNPVWVRKVFDTISLKERQDYSELFSSEHWTSRHSYEAIIDRTVGHAQLVYSAALTLSSFSPQLAEHGSTIQRLPTLHLMDLECTINHSHQPQKWSTVQSVFLHWLSPYNLLEFKTAYWNK